MTITKTDIFSLPVREGLTIIGVRIYTDGGIYGDGEVGLAYGWSTSAALGALQDLAAQITGMDPMANELIWDTLYKESFWGQNGGPCFFGGLSAIDMALWDIKGKALNVPLYQLLGGKIRSRVRCYASHVQYGWNAAADPDWLQKAGGPKQKDYAVRAKEAAAAGFDAIKMDIWEFDEEGNYLPLNYYQPLMGGKTLCMLEERLASVREAVGDRTDILLDAHAIMSVPSAVQFAKLAAKYKVLFLEEPVLSAPALVCQLKQETDLPLAFGERIYTRWQFKPFLDHGALQVAQPDIGNSGGITEVKKIADMAHACDVSVQPHLCASPLSVSAALHMEAAIPNFIIHEFYFEQQNGYMKRLCQYEISPENGTLAVPERPGIGNEWSDWFLRHARRCTIGT